MLRSIVKDLQEFTIRATDGDIGRVDHFLFDDLQWTVRYIVVDTGRWLPARRVLISPRAVARIDLDRRVLALDLTQQKIQDSPDIDTNMPVSRQKEMELHDYYGYPYYWGYVGGAGSWAAWSHPPGAIFPPLADPKDRRRRRQQRSPGDPHLRTTKEVTGYCLQASDGEAGRVQDLVVDDRSWQIRYLVVNTGGWIGGRDVLVPTDRVTVIDWDDSKVQVTVTREWIRASPRFVPSQVLNRENPAIPEEREPSSRGAHG